MKKYELGEEGIFMDESSNKQAYWFIFDNDKLLVRKQRDKVAILRGIDLEKMKINLLGGELYIGILEGNHCYGGQLAENQNLPADVDFYDLRSLLALLGEEMFLVAGRAFQILYWHQTHKYCGRCGSLTKTRDGQRAKKCSECGLVNYPSISPAIIVAVVKEGQLLLAHNKRFPLKFYSILAGFVEPGETFEECVMREVTEETGIKVRNIKYFGSQPWPFPHTLMVGFTAEYQDGDIIVDQDEIDDAGWFRPANLPLIPPKGSISRRLIDWFIENYQER